MAVQDYKINYKSDFVLNINGDAGWATQFCIKFWTGMPSQAYFVGFDGVKYVNCRVGDTPTQLLVMFDDHHLPIGKLMMQIAYHTTIEEFPGSVFDEVTNARDVIVTIDGTDYQVLLDFTGEDAPELEFDLPAYANEAERIQNELQRQQNEADRIAAELQREQATAAAVQGAENVNAQLNGTTLTVTNRNGVSTSVNTKGEQGVPGPVGPEGPQGEQGVSIVSFRQVYASETATYYSITFSDGHEQSVAIPKGAKGDTGATGPTGPQGPQGQTGVSITGFVETGETETDTLYNITFSNGTTQAVAIPKGEKGDQGPAGPVGPQGPMGDVAVITPEQQAAFTMYSVPGQNTNGPMTQKAVTDSLVGSAISYDNSQSGLAADDVQGALDEVIGNIDDIFQDNIESDFDISDEQGYAIVRFINGEIRTKYFDSSAVPTLGSSISDFAISDINGWDIVQFSGGHIKTKYFDSQLFVNTTKKFIGKKFAILGDSISTFQGWLPSDISGYDGSTYATYYSSGDVNSVTKTWWYQMLEILGINPSFDVVNNCSWSGSQVTGDADSTTNAYAGCSDRRISDLSIRGYVPDIVIVFISCNDWHRSVPVGNWDVNTALPTVGNTLRSAYAIMLNKINLSYPNARIFCCTNLDDVARDKTAGYPPDTNGVTTYSWNKNIIEIAEAFGCDVINMHDCGIKYSNVASLAVDTGLHPNAAGMKMMAQKVASELIAKY